MLKDVWKASDNRLKLIIKYYYIHQSIFSLLREILQLRPLITSLNMTLYQKHNILLKRSNHKKLNSLMMLVFVSNNHINHNLVTRVFLIN